MPLSANGAQVISVSGPTTLPAIGLVYDGVQGVHGTADYQAYTTLSAVRVSGEAEALPTVKKLDRVNPF